MAELDLEASAIVDAIDDALVVVSETGAILECNEAFAEIVAPDDGGDTERLDAALDSCPALKTRLERREEGIVPIEIGDNKRYYQLTVSDIETETDADRTLVVLHDVTEQQRQRHELERQNEQLDKFASFITHDLRNPLDVAIGRTTVVDELVDDPEIAEHVEEIRASHTRMVRIIQEVLTLARQGESIDDKSDVNLAETATEAWSHVETKDARLDVQTEQTVRADRNRLEHIFENLFRNSVEHSSTSNRPQADDTVEHSSTSSRTQPDDSVEHSSTSHRTQPGDHVRQGTVTETRQLTVTVGTLDDETGFYVADDGPGIDPEVRDRVLEVGFSNEDGTGLGLAIVSGIADAHGWEVSVSAAENGGTRFDFTGVDFVDST